MKKIDKLILKSFIGPFILTFFVVVFILLTKHMLNYFDDIIGKGLSWSVVGQLLFHFSIFMIPMAIPLAVLLSCLITFGNFGETFELMAIKSAGISHVRILIPIFVVVLILTAIAFYANNYLVTKAALEAYGLIYDIRQKKPAMALPEGVFYDEFPGISIKVNKKFQEDHAALKEIILYDHRAFEDNKEVIVADSGRMSTILGEQYLKFELFKGYRYTEDNGNEAEMTGQKGKTETLTRSKFSTIEMVYDLSSFDFKRTDVKVLAGDRLMKTLTQLDSDIDSAQSKIFTERLKQHSNRQILFGIHSLNDAFGSGSPNKPANDHMTTAKIDSIFALHTQRSIAQAATTLARQVKSQLANSNALLNSYKEQIVVFEIQWHRILANSVACIVMFLIGAPLGAIIKRGGLGVPFLVSILFFIIYYLLGIQGGKLAQQNILSPLVGVWLANILLLIAGLFFLRQARADARLFEADFYWVISHRLKGWLSTLRPQLRIK